MNKNFFLAILLCLIINCQDNQNDNKQNDDPKISEVDIDLIVANPNVSYVYVPKEIKNIFCRFNFDAQSCVLPQNTAQELIAEALSKVNEQEKLTLEHYCKDIISGDARITINLNDNSSKNNKRNLNIFCNLVVNRLLKTQNLTVCENGHVQGCMQVVGPFATCDTTLLNNVVIVKAQQTRASFQPFVGIGNLNPQEALDVAGNAIISGSLTANNIITNNYTSDSVTVTGNITSSTGNISAPAGTISAANANITGTTTLNNANVTNLTAQNLNFQDVTVNSIVDNGPLTVTGLSTLGMLNAQDSNLGNLTVASINDAGTLNVAGLSTLNQTNINQALNVGSGLLYVDTNSGYVGVNNSSPAYVLDVGGNANFSGDLTAGTITGTLVTPNISVPGNITSTGGDISAVNGSITGGSLNTPGGLNVSGVSTLAGVNANSLTTSGALSVGGSTNTQSITATQLTVDNSTLFIDSTHHRVGIGTASPNFLLDISGPANISGSLTATSPTFTGTTVVDNLTTSGNLIVNGTATVNNLTNGLVRTTSGQLLNSTVGTNDIDDQAVTNAKIASGSIDDSSIASNANISDSKLATIMSPYKVSNSATTATDSNTPGAIISRNSSGDFTAGTITATLNGSASAFSGTLAGDVTGLQGATVVSTVGGVTAADVASGATAANSATANNTATTIVSRDSAGNFSAGIITANLTGNVMGNITGNASGFTGSLSGDVTGTQSATVVSTVGGVSAGSVASGVNLANAATNTDTGNTIVKRDAGGNFVAGTITAALSGNATTATTANTASTVVGQTPNNSPTHVVQRDTNGNFAAARITLTPIATENAIIATGQPNTPVIQVNPAAGSIGIEIANTTANAIDVNNGQFGVTGSGNVTIKGTTNLTTLTTAGVLHNDSSGLLSTSLIVDADVDSNAAIEYSKLNLTGSIQDSDISALGISGAGKVRNSATTATATNTADTIVARDGSRNFSAGTITASLIGNVTGNSSGFTGSLAGDVTGTQSTTTVATVGGLNASSVASGAGAANAATDANMASTIVMRDSLGNFAAKIITADLNGTATNFSGNLSGDVTGTQSATVVAAVGGVSASNVASGTKAANAATDANTASTIVMRDGSGNFTANSITANLTGNVTGNITGNSAGFTGSLTGDVTGTQSATVVSTVGGATASDVASGASAANNARSAMTPNTIVLRDGSGNFSANIITANLMGSASNNVLKAGDTMTGTLQLNSTSGDAVTVNANATFNSTLNFVNGVPGLAKNILQVTNGPISGPNQFNSVAAAVAAIGTTLQPSSSSNPYIIFVGAGEFNETQTIALPATGYVAIVGQSPVSSIINMTTGENLITGAPNCSVENCTLTGATTSGSAAILHNTAGILRIFNCKFSQNNILVNLSAAAPLSEVIIQECNVAANSNFSTAFVVNCNSAKAAMAVNDFLWQPLSVPSNSPTFLNITGQNSAFIADGLTLGNLAINLGSTSTAFNVSAGATLRLNSVIALGFNKAIWVQDSAAASLLQINTLLCKNNTVDLQIDNPLTSGSVVGTFSSDPSKVIIAANTNLSLLSNDPVNPSITAVGPFNTGNNIDQITNISPQIQQGANIGVITDGLLSAAGAYPNLNLNIDAGTGYLMVGNSPNDYLQYIAWNAQSITLPTSQNNFVYIDKTGTAQITQSLPNIIQNVVLGRVQTDGSGIIYLQQTQRQAAHAATFLDDAWRQALGVIYISGSVVTQDATPLMLDVSSGSYFYSTKQYNPVGGSQINWTPFYRAMPSGTNIGTSTNMIDNYYDNGSGTLESIPAGQFVRHGFYICGDGANEKYLLVYGQTVYESQSAAANGSTPNPPPFFGDNIAQIASIIVTSDGTNPSIATTTQEQPKLAFKEGSSTGVTRHGDLTGLLNDDHPQYVLTNGIRVMTGDLNLGNNNIINLGTANGVTVEAHASRHLPNSADPIAYATPVTIGTINATGVANSFALSDHVHAHGAQTDPTLHALATTSSAGFMSSSDKTLLNSLDPANFVQKSGDTMTGRLAINPSSGNAITVNSNNFIVDSSGNTTTAGTLNVGSTVTLANLAGANPGIVHATNSGVLSSSLITNADIDPNAAIANSKLATIASSGKVANSATTATNLNNASTIVARDGSGNFIANTITASLIGNVTGNTSGSAASFTGSLSGDVTGTQTATTVATVGGVSASNVATGANAANAATSANTPSTIVARDSTGNFAAGTITASLNGTATNFSGSLAGDVTGTQNATVVSSVGSVSAANVASGANAANAATTTNTASTIVQRDTSGNFSAGLITANLTGNVTGNITGNSSGFTGSLSGDVTGTQSATAVATVGGVSAANVASGANAANAATNNNTASKIVQRDSSGNFSAGTITANLTGTASGNVQKTGDIMTGTLTLSPNSGNALIANGDGADTVVVNPGSGYNGITIGTTSANAIQVNGSKFTVVGSNGNTIIAGTLGVIGQTTLSNLATTNGGIVHATNSGVLSSSLITNADVDPNAAIADSKLATIASSGKVANSATTATNLNNASTIVARDGSGNFIANTITASLIGNVTGNTSGSAASFTGSLSGDVTGTQTATAVATVGGVTAANVASGATAANAATNANTASTIVKRDALGNFSAGTITATLSGSATNFSGLLTGDVTGTQTATTVATVGGVTAANVGSGASAANAATNANTASTIVKRDASGNFSAGTITAALTGNVTGSASLNVLKTGDTMTGGLTINPGNISVTGATSGSALQIAGNAAAAAAIGSITATNGQAGLQITGNGSGTALQIISNTGSGTGLTIDRSTATSGGTALSITGSNFATAETIAAGTGQTGLSITTSTGASKGLSVTASTSTSNAISVTGNNSSAAILAVSGTGQPSVAISDGTVAAPALAFNSEPGTGAYRIGTTSMGIATGGVNRMIFDANGGRHTSNYRMQAYANANRTLTAATETVRYNTINFDPGAGFNTGTFAYTAPVTGIYFVSAQISVVPTATNTSGKLQLLNNGATVTGYSSTQRLTKSGTSTSNMISLTTLISLTAGNTLSFEYTGAVGDAIEANDSSVAIHLLSI